MALHGESGVERGVELAGRYRLEEPIGAGGMGDVWRGTDLRLRRPVAIKILSAAMAADAGSVARFRREAETTAALQHPGITVMLDIDQHTIDQHTGGSTQLVFLVMELLSGNDLRTILKRQVGGLPLPFVVSVVAQVADALDAAHSRGVVHRDIKPANLFVLGDGRVKICDFGIARLGDATTRLTSTGNFIGTPLYMSPEQFQAKSLDARADLYSLGCVLYEMLTGTPPFNGDANPAALMYQHLNQVPPPPRSRRPDVPESVDRLTMDLLAKDPARRPPNAAAVARALHGPAAPTIPSGTAPPRKRRLFPYIAATIAVAVLAAGGIALVQRYGHKKRPVARPSAPSVAPPQSNPNPVVAGWRAVLAPGYGIAYDVPPGWKAEDPGTILGFDNSKGNGLDTTLERGVAHLDSGKCTRAQSGMRGGSDPVPTPSATQVTLLGGAATEAAHSWANAAYGAFDAHPHPPKLHVVRDDSLTARGIVAAREILAVTTTGRSDACTPPRAVVEAVAMAATRDSSTLGPLTFVVFADRGVRGQFSDADIDVIIHSVRPYHCPPGKTTHQGDNKCT